jgi:hypothetical protein
MDIILADLHTIKNNKATPNQSKLVRVILAAIKNYKEEETCRIANEFELKSNNILLINSTFIDKFYNEIITLCDPTIPVIIKLSDYIRTLNNMQISMVVQTQRITRIYNDCTIKFFINDKLAISGKCITDELTDKENNVLTAFYNRFIIETESTIKYDVFINLIYCTFDRFAKML